MIMGKFVTLFFGLAGLMAAPILAQADPPMGPPVPNQVYRSLESGKASHDAGTLHGTIEGVDYSSGTLLVKARGARQVVAVVPSTAIYRGGEYATLGDLRPGEHVEISVYEVGGRLVAQMIRFK